MFAHRVTYEDLTPERRERLKVSVLDSLACAITALGVAPTWRVWNKPNSSAVRTLNAL